MALREQPYEVTPTDSPSTSDESETQDSFPAVETVLQSLSNQVTAAFLELNQLEVGLRGRQRAADARAAELAAKEAELDAFAHQFGDQKSQLERAQQELARRSGELEVRESEELRKESELEAFAARFEEMQVELTSKDQALASRADELQREAASLDERRMELIKREQAVADCRREFEDESRALEAQRRELEAEKEILESATRALNELESNLRAREAVLAQKEEEFRRREADVAAANGTLEGRASEIDEDEARISDLDLREEAIAGSQLMLTRMQAPGNDVATEKVESVVDATSSAHAETDAEVGQSDLVQPVWNLEPAAEAAQEPPQEAEPAVDLSDFTPEELQRFEKRRRLNYGSDARIAADIRTERQHTQRAEGKNKHRWF